MILTPLQTLIIVILVALSSVITRFLPFIIFRNSNKSSSFITYLGKVLPYAAIGMLVVYCLKNVNITVPSYGIPEAIAILCIVLLHYWKENTLLSIGAGTAIYMILIRLL
ncbi:MAG TPA: branched-chain amino acid transporter AzlD [Clostridiales bacterium]|nr:branched-chain amino acid transporter AzlD [Clostridiales bacterium]